MEKNNVDNAITFYKLQWDTDYFGINCAKAIINKPLNVAEWNGLKDKFKDYQFVSIENRNSEPVNSQLIGKYTEAFLADVNIQFKKKLQCAQVIPDGITMHQGLERNDEIIDIADFQYSKFTEDTELAKRGGEEVYRQWLKNSFRKPEKHYALYKNEKGEITGFLLHSYSESACVVELIAVSKNSIKDGVGTSLFKAVEHVAYESGCYEIRVGTQVRNTGAINFYHKVGCKQVGCHQVFHLWN